MYSYMHETSIYDLTFAFQIDDNWEKSHKYRNVAEKLLIHT